MYGTSRYNLGKNALQVKTNSEDIDERPSKDSGKKYGDR
jgi:hypothetical protein